MESYGCCCTPKPLGYRRKHFKSSKRSDSPLHPKYVNFLHHCSSPGSAMEFPQVSNLRCHGYTASRRILCISNGDNLVFCCGGGFGKLLLKMSRGVSGCCLLSAHHQEQLRPMDSFPLISKLFSTRAAGIMSSSVYQWSWVGVTKIIFCSKLSRLPSKGISSSLMKQRSEKKK